MKKKMFDGIIFDIDNVLIDTRNSYLETIRWTIEIFLTNGKLPLFEPAPRNQRPALLSPEDVHQFKLLGGFNDDWDCCYGLLVYLLNQPIKDRSILALKKSIRLKKFVKDNPHRPMGINGIMKLFKRPPAVTIEKISQIFQEIYLGKNLFSKAEKKKTRYWNKKGLIENERLVFKKNNLEKLKNMGMKLGIATGRPRFEAEYSLKEFGVLNLFDSIITLDDVRAEEKKQHRSLRKPNPYSVCEVAIRLGREGNYVYVGDLPDDVSAANGAKKIVNMSSCAFIQLSDDPKLTLKELATQKPDFILKKPSELLHLAGKKLRVD